MLYELIILGITILIYSIIYFTRKKNKFTFEVGDSQYYNINTENKLLGMSINHLNQSQEIKLILRLSDVEAGVLREDSGLSNFNYETKVLKLNTNINAMNKILKNIFFIPSYNYISDFAVRISLSDGITTLDKTKNYLYNVGTSATNLNVTENYSSSNKTLIPLVVTELDGQIITLELTLSSDQGSLSTSSYDSIPSTYANLIWSATGTVTQINGLLNGIVFIRTGVSNFNLTITVSDTVVTNSTIGTRSFTYFAPLGGSSASQDFYVETPKALTTSTVTGGGGLNLVATITIPSNFGLGGHSQSNLPSLTTGALGSATSSFNAETLVWTATGAFSDVVSLMGSTVLSSPATLPTGTTTSSYNLSISVSVQGNPESAFTFTKTIVIYNFVNAITLDTNDTSRTMSFGFSLRKIVSSYSGPCLRVRKITGGVEQDISFVNGLVDTAAIATFCGVSDGAVSIWYNQAGNSDLNLSLVDNISGSTWPRIFTSGSIVTRGVSTNLPALSFNSVQRLRFTSLAGLATNSGINTIWNVGVELSDVARRRYIFLTPLTYSFGLLVDNVNVFAGQNTSRMDAGLPVSLPGIVSPKNAQVVYQSHFNSSYQSPLATAQTGCKINTSTYVYGVGIETDPGTNDIGRLEVGTGTTFDRCQEIVCWAAPNVDANSALTEISRNLIQTNLNSYYL
jgi:hypothetical protein